MGNGPPFRGVTLVWIGSPPIGQVVAAMEALQEREEIHHVHTILGRVDFVVVFDCGHDWPLFQEMLQKIRDVKVGNKRVVRSTETLLHAKGPF